MQKNHMSQSETKSVHEKSNIEEIEAELIRSGSRQVLTLKEAAGVVYLTYPALSECPFITHAFSTRIGGVSEGIWSTMNLSFTRGDSDQAVQENFRRMAAAIGVSCDDMVFSDQIHTTNVRIVTEADRGNGITRPKHFFETDGMITNVPGIVLTTFYADCVPLYFVDPVNHAIGLTHSGWRGTAGRIGQKTVELMHDTYGTNPADIIAAIGPSICKDCYEISEDVAEQFRKAFLPEDYTQFLFPQTAMPDSLLSAPNNSSGSSKYQLDLWKANELILLNAGIHPPNLFITDLCTCHNPKYLFSHRATQGKRGNLAAFLALKPNKQ